MPGPEDHDDALGPDRTHSMQQPLPDDTIPAAAALVTGGAAAEAPGEQPAQATEEHPTGQPGSDQQLQQEQLALQMGVDDSGAMEVQDTAGGQDPAAPECADADGASR
jgi:hypothetical protein